MKHVRAQDWTISKHENGNPSAGKEDASYARIFLSSELYRKAIKERGE